MVEDFIMFVGAAVLAPFLLLKLATAFAPFEDEENVTDVLLVIAHPDDEAMFFAPTLAHYASKSKVEIRVLCLSTGNGDGMGETRRTELLRSCFGAFGIRARNVTIIDDPLLLDGQSQKWSPVQICKHLEKVMNRAFSCRPSGHLRIITFDSGGVSGHPNHIDTFDAVTSHICPFACITSMKIDCFALRTVGLAFKYFGPASALLHWFCFSSISSMRILTPDIGICSRAMSAHASQLLWYRRIFTRMASYAYFNELQSVVRVPGAHRQNNEGAGARCARNVLSTSSLLLFYFAVKTGWISIAAHGVFLAILSGACW